MKQWRKLHIKVQNRLSYWKILARKRGVTLNSTNLSRLKKEIEDNVLPDKMSFDDLFSYKYGPLMVMMYRAQDNAMLDRLRRM